MISPMRPWSPTRTTSYIWAPSMSPATITGPATLSIFPGLKLDMKHQVNANLGVGGPSRDENLVHLMNGYISLIMAPVHGWVLHWFQLCLLAWFRGGAWRPVLANYRRQIHSRVSHSV